MQKLDVEHNSKTFWTSIKKLQGTGDQIKETYIKDHNDRPICNNTQKENIFRHYW